MRFLHSSVTFIFLSFYWNLSAEAVSVYPDKNWARKSLSKSGKVVQAKLGTLLFGKDKPKSTDGVVIIHKGKLIYEGYKSPFGPKKKHIIWSVSKSYMSALIGMAVYENKLKLDHSICNFGYRTNCSITIRSLHWASGLEWQETYENSRHPADSNVLSMLYGRNRFDTELRSRSESSSLSSKKHLYSSGDTNLLSGILKKIYQKDYEAFVFENYWRLLGHSLQPGSRMHPDILSHHPIFIQHLEIWLDLGTSFCSEGNGGRSSFLHRNGSIFQPRFLKLSRIFLV